MNKHNKIHKKIQTIEPQTGTLYYACIYDELALKIGLNEAIFLYKLHVLTAQSRRIEDGYPWVFNSATTWSQKYFPYWSIRTVKRIIQSLKQKNLIILGEYNKFKYDKTSWFRINYQTLQQIVPAIVTMWTHPWGQNGPMDSANMAPPIPNNKKYKEVEEKTAEKPKEKDSQEEKMNEKLHGLSSPQSHFTSQEDKISFALSLNSLIPVSVGAQLSITQKNRYPLLNQFDLYTIAKETGSLPSRVERSYNEFFSSIVAGKAYGARSTIDGVTKFVIASKTREERLPPELRGDDLIEHPDKQLTLASRIEDAHPVNIARKNLNSDYMRATDEGNQELINQVFKRMDQIEELKKTNFYELQSMPF